MSRVTISKVFLVVTIPTHLRCLMEVADMLRACGRYEPQIVYYPSAVFDQNHGNCRDAAHDAFVWTGTVFDYRAANPAVNNPAINSVKQPAPENAGGGTPASRSEKLQDLLSESRIYTGLLRIFRFLPPPTEVVSRARRSRAMLVSVVEFFMAKLLIPTIRFSAKSYGLIRASLLALSGLSRTFTADARYSDAFTGRSWGQRLFLFAFAKEWEADLPPFVGRKSSIIGRLATAFKEGMFSGIAGQKAFYRGLSELIAKEGPALIVLPEENLFYHSHLIVHAAHSQKIPCVIVPFSIVNTLEWAEAFFQSSRFHADSGWNIPLAKAFPHWILHHRGRRLILPAIHILTCEYLGVVPDQPWVINSGAVDAIAGESQFMCDYYRRAGIKPGKIRLTGALSDDKLYALLLSREEQRKALATRSGINIEGKIVLIGLPPDQFGGGKRKGCEFDGYAQLVQFMVGVVAELCAKRNTVLINLHPRVKREQVAYLESLGATIVAEPIDQLVPLADIYVSVVSATIRLAISCGVPVINYDAYQYDYDDYKALPGVLEVKTKEAFRNSLAALLQDKAFYSEVRAAQKDTVSQLCSIDGNAGARLLGLFDDMSSRGSGTSAANSSLHPNDCAANSSLHPNDSVTVD